MKNSIMNGDIAEVFTLQKLMEHGYFISMPFSHNTQYDIIADTPSGLKRIQVKKAYRPSHKAKEGQMCVETRRILVKHSGEKGSVARSYGDNAYDYLIACDTRNEIFWIIPFKVAKRYKAQIYLHTDKMQEFKNHWALLGTGK